MYARNDFHIQKRQTYSESNLNSWKLLNFGSSDHITWKCPIPENLERIISKNLDYSLKTFPENNLES